MNKQQQVNFHFPIHFTRINPSNLIGNINSRYSSSNFYRAAAVAAVTSDPNNRRYMPNTPVCDDYRMFKSKREFCFFHSGQNRIVLVIVLNLNPM